MLDHRGTRVRSWRFPAPNKPPPKWMFCLHLFSHSLTSAQSKPLPPFPLHLAMDDLPAGLTDGVLGYLVRYNTGGIDARAKCVHRSWFFWVSRRFLGCVRPPPLVEGVGGSMEHLRHRYAHARTLDDGSIVDDFLPVRDRLGE